MSKNSRRDSDGYVIFWEVSSSKYWERCSWKNKASFILLIKIWFLIFAKIFDLFYAFIWCVNLRRTFEMFFQVSKRFFQDSKEWWIVDSLEKKPKKLNVNELNFTRKSRSFSIFRRSSKRGGEIPGIKLIFRATKVKVCR